MKLPLVREEEVAEDTMAFHFDLDEKLDFKPGQFGNFVLEDMVEEDSKGNMRSFSIASSPNDEELMIATRMRDSAFKNTLKEMEEGDEINFMGPMGNFTLHRDTDKPAVLLAGGIGITPYRSMIKYATEEDTDHEIYLFYSNRTPESTAFLEDLEEWEEENENFTLIPTITHSENPDWDYEYGRIGPDMYEEYLSDDVIQKAVWYIVGPPGMVRGVRESLLDWRVDELMIESEDFSGY